MRLGFAVRFFFPAFVSVKVFLFLSVPFLFLLGSLETFTKLA
jgi:hypothetical protein